MIVPLLLLIIPLVSAPRDDRTADPANNTNSTIGDAPGDAPDDGTGHRRDMMDVDFQAQPDLK